MKALSLLKLSSLSPLSTFYIYIFEVGSHGVQQNWVGSLSALPIPVSKFDLGITVTLGMNIGK